MLGAPDAQCQHILIETPGLVWTLQSLSHSMQSMFFILGSQQSIFATEAP